MSSPKKRKTLTVEDKKSVIEAAANNSNKTALAKQFNIPQRTIGDILDNKEATSPWKRKSQSTRRKSQSAFNLACRYVLKKTANSSILGHSDDLDEFFNKERQKDRTMFWNTLGLEYLVEERQLEKKLRSPDVKLATVLEDMHCFQEIRNSNENVLNYLKAEPVFRELLEAVLCPEPSDAPFQKDNYKFAHQCCEALCLASRDFFKQLLKHEALLHKLISFFKLQTGNLNHLIVSFYSKLVISFLSAEPDTFLTLLEESDFWTVASRVWSFVLERVKKWYYSKGFADYLLALLSPDQPSEIHENVGAIWAEFIKALREIQYNVEVSPDLCLILCNQRKL
uniref:HTH psq-type domain-containing protein n=1 Tax=Ditylenchus dipsaci TaxID=166011 RepID=A0A915CLN7_9BILA